MATSFDAMEMIEQSSAGIFAGLAMERVFDMVSAELPDDNQFQKAAIVMARLAANGVVLGSVIDYVQGTGRDWPRSPLGASVFVIFAIASQPQMILDLHTVVNKVFDAFMNLASTAERSVERSVEGSSKMYGDAQLQGPTSRQLDTAGQTIFSKPSDDQVAHYDL